MAKAEVTFVCSDCGGESLRWSGQCPHCRAWNTLQEFQVKRSRKEARGIARLDIPKAVPVTAVDDGQATRLQLGWQELNRVLGGGFVPGEVVLVGGEPGVGKSTLLLHAAEQVTATGGTVLYASGEESAAQIRMRAGRLDLLSENLLVLADDDVGRICEEISTRRPALAIVDSIQTVADPGVESAAGTVSQVREGAARLLRVAKDTGVPVVLVGHVTKEGAIAGPRVLEHMVDAVLYLEGEKGRDVRVLRATKNRFGSTDEIGIFTMGEEGLEEVLDPSGTLVEDGLEPLPGVAILPAVEGSRPLLVEVQALVGSNDTQIPRRTANGIELNRLQMLVAVLSQRAGVGVGTYDVLVNIAGGIRVEEPAADLAVALAIASSKMKRALPPATVVFGEVALTGRVRRVGRLDRRLAEAARHGYRTAIVPAGSSGNAPPGMRLLAVENLAAAVEHIVG